MDHMGQPCEAQGGVWPPLGLTGLPPLLEMDWGPRVSEGVGTSLDKGGWEMDGTHTHTHTRTQDMGVKVCRRAAFVTPLWPHVLEDI